MNRALGTLTSRLVGVVVLMADAQQARRLAQGAGSRVRTRLTRRMVAVLGVMTAATVIVASIGVPAMAGPNCPAGYHCVMKDNISDSERHDYFNSDPDFTNDVFRGGTIVVNDRVSAASNSSTAGYESHYYRHVGYRDFLFCVNPNSYVTNLPTGVNDQASSLLLRPTTPISCF